MARNVMGILLISLALICGCLKEKEKIVYEDRHTEVSYLSKENDQPHELTISNISWEWEETYIGGCLTVSGKVKNTGTVELGFVRIYVKSYDGNNNVTSSDDTYVGTLNVQGEDSWEISDWDCKTNPARITIGYSYDTEILVNPAKRVFGVD